jgi:hypothetical protein
MQATTIIYTKTVPASVCAAACTNTPTNVLADGVYKWRVRAKIGGLWKAWSAFKNFTVQTNTNP